MRRRVREGRVAAFVFVDEGKGAWGADAPAGRVTGSGGGSCTLAFEVECHSARRGGLRLVLKGGDAAFDGCGGRRFDGD